MAFSSVKQQAPGWRRRPQSGGEAPGAGSSAAARALRSGAASGGRPRGGRGTTNSSLILSRTGRPRAHPVMSRGTHSGHALGALTRSSAARPPLEAAGALAVLQQLPDDGDYLLALLQVVGTPDEAVLRGRALVVGYDVLAIAQAHGPDG